MKSLRQHGGSELSEFSEPSGPGLQVRYVTIHGHRRAYVLAGSGPVLLLLHGMAVDHHTWDPVIERLAEHHTVLAPDLLGHGVSDKPRADYSIGGYANAMRDLMTVLGIQRATVVGHSFGGGVAMQFAYQFPERTERVVLVSTGGLGREVSPVIRAVALPGFRPLMGLVTLPVFRQLATTTLRTTGGVLGRVSPAWGDVAEVADILDEIADPRARRALAHVVRACVDHRGQIISMIDRAYLAHEMPLCVVWGADDLVIPVTHAEHARTAAPNARVEVLPASGHFPHRDHPAAFAAIIEDFVADTAPATHHRGRWRALLKNGAPAGVALPDSRVATIA